MRTLTILKGVAAVALLTSFGAANAAHEFPSPCEAGNVGAGSNCMYLTAAGATYDAISGDRTLVTNSLTINIDVWFDFGTSDTEGGAFDIVSDGAVSSMSWAFMETIDLQDSTGGNFQRCEAGIAYADRGTCDTNADSMRFMQFDDGSFDTNGGYGPGNTGGVFEKVGTLTITFASYGTFNLSMNNAAYDTNTFPNCFVLDNGMQDTCTPTNFYDLTVETSAVPLPAAVWLMLAGIGSLGSFARRRG